LTQLVGILQDSFYLPVAVLLGVLIARVLFRRAWIAYTALVLLPISLNAAALFIQRRALTSPENLLQLAGTAAFGALVLLVLTRVGLLALLVAIVFSYWQEIVLTTNPSSWMFGQSVGYMIYFLTIAVYGFWVSLGQQKLFKDLA
jgi:predicted membrane protein